MCSSITRMHQSVGGVVPVSMSTGVDILPLLHAHCGLKPPRSECAGRMCRVRPTDRSSYVDLKEGKRIGCEEGCWQGFTAARCSTSWPLNKQTKQPNVMYSMSCPPTPTCEIACSAPLSWPCLLQALRGKDYGKPRMTCVHTESAISLSWQQLLPVMSPRFFT